MLKEIVIATKNKGKLKEFSNLLAKSDLQVLSLADFYPLPDVLEDGRTFAENAIKKAEFASKILGLPVIADDSGLSVAALDGQPGIYSARFAGEEHNDEKNNQKLLRLMDPIADEHRSAQFVCAISLAIPEEDTLVFEGTCKGQVTRQPRGVNGFGYDPLFYLPEYNKTMAEIDPEQKNRLSHRAVALEKLMSYLSESQLIKGN